jgi:hypothetical protein
VKRAIGIISLFFLLALHWVATSAEGDRLSGAARPAMGSHSYFTPAPTGLPHEALDSKTGINAFQHTPPSSLKTPAHKFSAYAKTAGRLIFFKFSQYVFFSENITVRFRKTDLIFPFHYFW